MNTAKPRTLLVEFTPRGDESRTRKLRKYLTDQIKDYSTITSIDLTNNLPPLMDQKVLKAYYKRNYRGEKLTPEESAIMQPFDLYRDQLMNNDILIISTPMYNFGMPAPVKAWLDAAMQRGYAYTSDEKGHVPLLQHLKVCLIYTSGIVYDQVQENEHWNGLLSEGAELFDYMGARVIRRVGVEGVDMLEDEHVKFRTEKVAHVKLNSITKEWYSIKHDLPTTFI